MKQFLITLDLVLPRPEALPYIKDARTLGHIQIRARNRYRGGERPIGKEVGEKVRKLIDKLPERYRAVLILKFLEEKSYEEISDILKIPGGTVATQLNRAKIQFKQLAIDHHLHKPDNH